MENTLQIEKILSTSLTYSKNNIPQWVSDTQLNYMSQHDFITYDLDEDRLDLIPRPSKERAICVKYMPLIGHYNVRIVYLYRNEQKGFYYFVMLPSLNFNEGFFLKKVSLLDRKVKWIQDFIYFSDGHFVIFSVLFENEEVGVVCMNLLNSHYFLYILKLDKEDNSEKSEFEFINELSEAESDNLMKMKESSLLSTKSQSDCVLFYNNTLYLMRLSKSNNQFLLLHQIQIAPKIPIYSPLQCSTLILSKTYLVIKNSTEIKLYYIDEDKIHQGAHHDIQRNSENSEIGSLTCSLHSNKIIVSIKNTSILLQYRINDISDIIEYVNCIDFENQFSHISQIIVSDTGRNVAIFSFADKHKDIEKGCTKIHGEEITNVRIFKIELYTELGIPDYTLCLKQIKYTNRNKRVNRLVIPKIYQKIYALTGAEVHSLQAHKISGVMFFDIHPFGFYMAISYHYNIKIFSIQSNSMTLLYSMSLQNLKKIMFSPDGSSLVMFSPKHLKILDAYSFQIKYEIFEKSACIIDISFSQKKSSLLILYENGVLTERSFYDFDKIKIYRIYGQGHRRVTCFRMDEKNENIYFVLEDGSLIIKHANNLTTSEISLWYEDEQKITQLYIDTKNCLVFVGTKAGILRIHNIQKEKFSIANYEEISVSEYEITAMVCSHLENCIYVGNITGDITMLKYTPSLGENFLAKSTKILQSVAPKVAPYFSFDFQLISHTKFQGNAEQNILEDKLQNLIEKIQNHTSNYKRSLIDTFVATQKTYFTREEEASKTLYKDYDGKCKKVKLQIHSLKEKFYKDKKDAIEVYETNIKKVFVEQEEIQKRKTSLLKTQEEQKNEETKKMNQQETKTKQQYEKIMQQFELFYKKQKYTASLDDLDNDFKISDADVLKTLNVKLNEELINLRARCQELKKNNSYLQTAKFNILSRKVQQETLQHRINQQLKLLREMGNKQQQKISTISTELRCTQEQIHRIQNKVKNTPNNVISADKADSDLCSYKIWMKDKVQEEISQLSQYLTGLEDSFETKSQEIVELSNRIRINEQKIHSNKAKEQQLKDKLKNCQYRLVMLQNNNAGIEKNIHPNLLSQLKLQANETGYSFQANKAQKIAYIEKLNQKALYFQNKNLKIHVRKIKNLNANNAELLHEYEKLKYQNKWLLDKQIENQLSLKRLKQAALQKQRKKSEERGIQSERTSVHKQNQTPFSLYVKNRASKTKRSLNCLIETGTSTFSRLKNTTMRSATTSRIY